MKPIISFIIMLVISHIANAQSVIVKKYIFNNNNGAIAASQVKYTPYFHMLQPKTLQTVPENYYATHLGFFCRQEINLQKANFPLSFRVGSLDQCNYLEQKPGYR